MKNSNRIEPLIKLSPTEQKIIKVTGFTLGFSLLGWITFAIVKKAVKKGLDNKETRKTLDKEEPAYYATLLYLAMDGFGTSEQAIRAVFRELKDWNHYKEVAKSYERKYGSILADDLESELDETEIAEIMEIANELKLPKDRVTEAHINSWSNRLRKAWDLSCWFFSCTDEDAAYSVLRDILQTVDPRGALAQLEKSYQRKNLISLQEEAESEMSGQDLQTWNTLIEQIKNNQ